MNLILLAAIFGILGALVRILVVSLKAIQMKKEISKSGAIVYIIVIIAIGAFSGIIFDFGKILSFLAGYAGLDLIDGYYKTFKTKKIKFN